MIKTINEYGIKSFFFGIFNIESVNHPFYKRAFNDLLANPMTEENLGNHILHLAVHFPPPLSRKWTVNAISQIRGYSAAGKILYGKNFGIIGIVAREEIKL